MSEGLSMKSDEIIKGYIRYENLSSSTQGIMLKRQFDKAGLFFREKIYSPTGYFVYLILLFAWFGALFCFSKDVYEETTGFIWLFSITTGVGLLIGWFIKKIKIYSRSILKPYFYLTPLNFLKTINNIVEVLPIVLLEDIKITHNFTNGAYTGSVVLLKFEDGNYSVNIHGQNRVEEMLNLLKEFKIKIYQASVNRDAEYFLKNDEFNKNILSPVIIEQNLVSKKESSMIFVVSALGSIILFFVAKYVMALT